MRRGLIVALLLAALSAAGQVTHVTGSCSVAGSGTVDGNGQYQFSCTPGAANHALIIAVGYGTGQPITNVTLAAAGWTITPLSGVVGSSSYGYTASFAAIAPNTSVTTFTVTWTGFADGAWTNHHIDEFSGNDTTGGATTFYAHNEGTGASTCPSVGVTSTSANDAVWGYCQDGLAASNWQGSGWTAGVSDGQGDGTEYKMASGAQTPIWASSSGASLQLAVAVKAAGAAATTDLSGFQWRHDDGSESAATGLAAEDTNVTQPLNSATRLRMQVDTSGDAPSIQYQLEYKLSTNSVYIKVGSPDRYLTPTIHGETTNTGTTNATDGTFSVSKPTAPAACADNDYLIVLIGKITTTVGTSVAPPDGSWVTGNQLRTSTGNDTYGGIFYKLITSAAGEPASYTFDSNGTSETFGYWAGCVANLDQTTPQDVAFNGAGAWANKQNDTSPNLPAVTTVTPNAFAIGGWSVNSDTSVTMPGGSWGTRANNVGTFNVVSQIFPTAGTSTGTPEITAVATNQETQVGMFVFRPAADAAPIALALSSNFADGDATTAQLSVPNGHSFTAGKISETSNPAAAVDIAADNYTELEWNLIAQSPATNADVYTFRVTEAGTPLSTYSVTPQWTIGTPGAATTARGHVQVIQ